MANRPIYMAQAVTCEGTREFLGLWAGDGGDGAKYWMHVLTQIKNRGVADVCMLVCDGLKGLFPRRSRLCGRRRHSDLCGAPAADLVSFLRVSEARIDNAMKE